MGDGEQDTCRDMRQRQPVDGQNDEVGIERELHGGEWHGHEREQRQRGHGAQQMPGLLQADARGGAGLASVVARPHGEKHDADHDRQQRDHRKAGIRRQHGNRRQGQRAQHGAELVAGLADREDQRPLLRPRQAGQQRRACRRLGAERQAQDGSGDDQCRSAAAHRGRHGGGHGQGTQRGDRKRSEPRRQHAAGHGGGDADDEDARREERDVALADAELGCEHPRGEQGEGDQGLQPRHGRERRRQSRRLRACRGGLSRYHGRHPREGERCRDCRCMRWT